MSRIRLLFYLLLVALVVFICALEVGARRVKKSKSIRSRTPTRPSTPTRPPRMPPTVRKQPKGVRVKKVKLVKPPKTNKPATERRGAKTNTRNKPTPPSVVDLGRQYTKYQLPHSRRMWKLAHATYCKPEGTWIRKWVASVSFPRAPRRLIGPYKRPEVKSFYSTASSTDFQAKLYGHVIADPNDGSISVSFRGSSNLDNWITNAKLMEQTGYVEETQICPTDAVKSPEECLKFSGHSGFLTGYLGLQAQIQQAVGGFLKTYNGPIHVSGHSLGGALAMLCAVDLRLQYEGRLASVYTFGQPRTADERLAGLIKSMRIPYFRVVNMKDPVPHVPRWPTIFVHGGTEVWYRKGALISGGKPMDRRPMVCASWTSAPKGSCSETIPEYRDSQSTYKSALYFIGDHRSHMYMDGRVCSAQGARTSSYGGQKEDTSAEVEDDAVINHNETTKVNDFMWEPKYVWIMKGTPEWDAVEAARAAKGSFSHSTVGQAVIGVSAALALLVAVAVVSLVIRRKWQEGVPPSRLMQVDASVA